MCSRKSQIETHLLPPRPMPFEHPAVLSIIFSRVARSHSLALCSLLHAHLPPSASIDQLPLLYLCLNYHRQSRVCPHPQVHQTLRPADLAPGSGFQISESGSLIGPMWARIIQPPVLGECVSHGSRLWWACFSQKGIWAAKRVYCWLESDRKTQSFPSRGMGLCGPCHLLVLSLVSPPSSHILFFMEDFSVHWLRHHPEHFSVAPFVPWEHSLGKFELD